MPGAVWLVCCTGVLCFGAEGTVQVWLAVISHPLTLMCQKKLAQQVFSPQGPESSEATESAVQDSSCSCTSVLLGLKTSHRAQNRSWSSSGCCVELLLSLCVPCA